MDKYLSKAHFHLPGVFEFAPFYAVFLDLYKLRKEVFKDNLVIDSIYGSPGLHIWNGGRMVQTVRERQDLERVKGIMEHAGVSVRFTFTNCMLKEEHLLDTMCNNTVKLFHSSNNDILCNSPILEEYLRKNYPKYNFISSTTKGLVSKDDVSNEINKEYKLVVLDYSLNKKFELLKDMKGKERLEILCNAVCFPNCPRRQEHYKNISLAQIENNPSMLFECEAQGYRFDKAMKMPHFVSVDNINEYLSMGFKNFKLEGRTAHPLDLIEILLYYLIKEDYKPEIRSMLQSIVW